MDTLKVAQHPVAAETRIDPNGREYLITTSDGAVFVALTLTEAMAIADLWRTRQPSISSSIGRRR